MVAFAAAAACAAAKKNKPAPVAGADGVLMSGVTAISRPAEKDAREPLTIKETVDGMAAQVPSARIFEKRLKTSADAPRILEEVVKWLRRQPVAKNHPRLFVAVEAYTDSRGAKLFNKRFSEKQAKWVASYLSSKLPNFSFESYGRGEDNPIASNATPEGREANRRLEIVVPFKQPFVAPPVK